MSLQSIAKSSAVAGCIALAAAAFCVPAAAQHGPDRGGPPGHSQGHGNGHDKHDNGHHDDRHDNRRNGPPPRYNGPPPAHVGYPQYHRYQRGDRLPPEYHSRQYVVNDWHARGLRQPPRGSYWVQNGSDYVLAAVATGIISAVVINAIAN